MAGCRRRISTAPWSCSLLCGVTAIHREGLAGDERRTLGAEPDDGARDLSRLPDSSDGMGRYQHLLYFGRGCEVTKHSCLDRRRSDGIHSNVVLGVFERDGLRQPDDGMLAGGVDRCLRKAYQSCDGGIVDDCAAAGLQHRWNLVLQRQPHALDVNVHDLIVGLFGLIGQRSQRLLDPGVVERTIEPAEGRQRPFDRRLDVALLRDVGSDEDRLAAGRLDPSDDFLALSLTASADDYLRALLGEFDSHTGAARSPRCDSRTLPSTAVAFDGLGLIFANRSTATNLALAIIERVGVKEGRCRDGRVWSL